MKPNNAHGSKLNIHLQCRFYINYFKRLTVLLPSSVIKPSTPVIFLSSIMFRGPDRQSDYCSQGKAKVRILDFESKMSEFQRSSQTAGGKAKLSYIYSI